ncbi:MAG: aminomethyl-transferring glycine dehydrogenase subunit GcvPB [Gemmatimonadota bacterium]|nr:aminomethyl-transferring glycine dehydrogenase subunit GcvPB [Gemmatimonadota bacterium]MDP6529070.1 aminomethyl-transferring glycine dehydrogenase subunit GcvPB [Gemmatimonadota bacterium]MDP6802324.1 aminomethyl-transferring glycine dehydrogenase subunit GcvPB [Gemmatimonadota bacterium]MDP7031942.1 aminomethyl-transferring glycine dehydrogenase subunit GcvPB [Gemmatimonadota bacterium]
MTVVEPTLFEMSRSGRRGYRLPEESTLSGDTPGIAARFLRETPPDLPENSELAVVRHFTRLSNLNHHIEKDMYPLGSCTMKYNPKMCEVAAAAPGLRDLHPHAPEEASQGALELLVDLADRLSVITGMHRMSLQPAAGAHGELTCLLMARRYFEDRGEDRTEVIVPDSAHGTNPASSSLAGFRTVEALSGADGEVDPGKLAEAVSDKTAVVMLTLPNTLGLFESRILEIARIVHDAGALLYMDGANFNAIIGLMRPGDVPFDLLHLNLHKTFATPHGGGGPGAGPIGASEALSPYLPAPLPTRRQDGTFFLDTDRPRSAGRVHTHLGNFGVLARAYAYLLYHGAEGLRDISEGAVLGANYLKSLVAEDFEIPYDRACMHEFVISGTRQKALGVRTHDMAKRLLDFGFHPPTVYFPLIVEEAMMIEPTESESVETLDRFAAAMNAIAREVRESPEVVKAAPHTTPVSRVDEARAARRPDLCWPGRCG